MQHSNFVSANIHTQCQPRHTSLRSRRSRPCATVSMTIGYTTPRRRLRATSMTAFVGGFACVAKHNTQGWLASVCSMSRRPRRWLHTYLGHGHDGSCEAVATKGLLQHEGELGVLMWHKLGILQERRRGQCFHSSTEHSVCGEHAPCQHSELDTAFGMQRCFCSSVVPLQHVEQQGLVLPAFQRQQCWQW